MRALPATGRQSLPEALALIEQMLRHLDRQGLVLAEHERCLAERDRRFAERHELLQRKHREIALREAKLEKLEFEIALRAREVRRQDRGDQRPAAAAV